MNEAHFFLFFLYIFDLHNLQIEGKLRSVANPISEYRYELIKDAQKHNDLTEEVVDLIERMVVKDNPVEDVVLDKAVSEPTPMVSRSDSEFSCKLCKANYKRAGNLTLHMKNKHPDLGHVQQKCKVCGSLFDCTDDLQKHMSIHCKCTVCDIPFDDVKYLNPTHKS